MVVGLPNDEEILPRVTSEEKLETESFTEVPCAVDSQIVELVKALTCGHSYDYGVYGSDPPLGL